MITHEIEKFLKLFEKMTKEEADFIAEVLKWNPEKKAGFLLAKRIFEDDNGVIHNGRFDKMSRKRLSKKN